MCSYVASSNFAAYSLSLYNTRNIYRNASSIYLGKVVKSQSFQMCMYSYMWQY